MYRQTMTELIARLTSLITTVDQAKVCYQIIGRISDDLASRDTTHSRAEFLQSCGIDQAVDRLYR